MSKFVWATVTAIGPVRVQIDGDTAALSIAPDSLIDPLTLAVSDRVRCEWTNKRIVIHGASNATYAHTPVGKVEWGIWLTGAPAGYLDALGQAVSRATYPALYAQCAPIIGAPTITIASPGVLTLNGHGLPNGAPVFLTTTGALPTGIAANTILYVVNATTNTFQLSATSGGAAINTTGAQSGVHTVRFCPFGLGDGATTFNVPNIGERAPVGYKSGSAEFGWIGETVGAKTVAHSHTLSDAAQALIQLTTTKVEMRRVTVSDSRQWTHTLAGSSFGTDSGTVTSGAALAGVTDTTSPSVLQPSMALRAVIKF
jgi:microcystin-dependent protein